MRCFAKISASNVCGLAGMRMTNIESAREHRMAARIRKIIADREWWRRWLPFLRRHDEYTARLIQEEADRLLWKLPLYEHEYDILDRLRTMALNTMGADLYVDDETYSLLTQPIIYRD